MTNSFKENDNNATDDDSESSYRSSQFGFSDNSDEAENEMSEDEVLNEPSGSKTEEEDDEEDEVVKAIKAEKTKPRDHPPAIICEDFIVDISLHPAKNLIAIANIVGDVLLYEYNNDETKLVNSLELHLKACRDVEFDDEGTTLFSTAKDKVIMATDVETGKLKRCYEDAHEEPVYRLITLDKDKIVTGDDGGTVKLWDMRKPEPVFSINIGDEHVSDMITNDAQKYLVCAAGDGILTTIDLKGSKIYTTSEEYDAELTCMGLFRSDTKLLVAASTGKLYLFNWKEFGLHSDEYVGRFGNQADHFLGALAFSKGLNRTLILPPWVEYRYGEPRSIQVPFNTYFNVQKLSQYHKVITMELFMHNIAPTIWAIDKRISFCYTQRTGEIDNSCNAKSGNPFGPFWDTFGIDFVGSEFYGPLNYDVHNAVMMEKWQIKYPPDKFPVLAFTGAPASFPVQKENVHLQKYLQWSADIVNKTRLFIKKNMSGGGFIGIHLRNGQDWVKACQHIGDTVMLFAAPQCVGYKNERGPLTLSMCLPQPTDVIKQVKRALKKHENIKYVFVASDSNHMVDELNKGLHRAEVAIIRLQPSNPHLDLAILGQANYFIGNCVSSYSAFVKRERDVTGLPSEFWSFPHRRKSKHEEL